MRFSATEPTDQTQHGGRVLSLTGQSTKDEPGLLSQSWREACTGKELIGTAVIIRTRAGYHLFERNRKLIRTE